jgi:23S rRNA pseudouridine1911/1915/1917 synthase
LTHSPEDPDDLDPDATLDAVMEPSDERLDKALTRAWPELSRARLQALIASGRLSRDGVEVRNASARVTPGRYRLTVPPPQAAEPEAQDLPLSILHEDAHLVVVDKPAGMAAHPAPGAPDGTLVNALLHHCGDSLSGVGGVARPGIVHRLDKDTSGVMVAAKTDAAHAGLSALFSTHDIERSYIALTRGAPSPERGRIHTRIGRSNADRKKMAVLTSGGREAITDYGVRQTYGRPTRLGGPSPAAQVVCTLHTGRTHQIRVHLASKGAPILGDPVYGSGAPSAPVRDAIAASGLGRQALHAAVLGFVHPITGERLRFETPPPEDMAALLILLEKL